MLTEARENPGVVNIRNIYWAESSFQPMNDSLFLGYTIICDNM